MEKIDLKKQLKQFYSPSTREVAVVDVPEMNFLMIDGEGNPNTAKCYKDAVAALFSVSYTLKFLLKKGGSANIASTVDYGVMPLEGLWWMNEGTPFQVEDKDAWKWTVMIMQPVYVTRELFEEARSNVSKKKDLSALAHMRFTALHEGPSVQIMHIGSYAQEGPTVAKLHAFIEANNWKLRAKHHEIYLKDATRTAPERLQTIIRQPFA
ncbi:MAG TPA: GyrI-like domain-containing protein [Ktedonobacteraceae bacterium]|nr:GyrI-like domain-containing protein [Ktedonobacteraceae bacterium]